MVRRRRAWAAVRALRSRRPRWPVAARSLACANTLYDRGILRAERSPIPAVSVGNLTVGGTGKTPIAAWMARAAERAARTPAIVLRGYGDDEPLVHRVVNPDVPVIVDAGSRGGSARRGGAGGATSPCSTTRFQHRRARASWPTSCWSARIGGGRRSACCRRDRGASRLPRCQRATLVIVTRKAADARIGAVAHATRCRSSRGPGQARWRHSRWMSLHDVASGDVTSARSTSPRRRVLGGRRDRRPGGVRRAAARRGRDRRAADDSPIITSIIR